MRKGAESDKGGVLRKVAESDDSGDSGRFCASWQYYPGPVPTLYTLPGTPPRYTVRHHPARAITSLITDWSRPGLWRLARSRTGSFWQANTPSSRGNRAGKKVFQRRLLSHFGTSPGPGRPEPSELTVTIPARLLTLLFLDLRGTNQIILVRRYFTHNNP